jgi:hypothetical protein
MLQQIEKDYMTLSDQLNAKGTRLRGQRRYELMRRDKEKQFQRFCKKHLEVVGNEYRIWTSPATYVFTDDRDAADDFLHQMWMEKR